MTSVVVAGIGRTVSYFKLRDLADFDFSCVHPFHPFPSNSPSNLLSVLRISFLTNSFLQSTTTGSCSGPPSSPALGSSAPASPPCALSSAAYHPSPLSVPSGARSVFTPCALPKVLPKVPAMRAVTPDRQAIRTKGLRTLKRLRALVPSTITSPPWNWGTEIELRRPGMAKGTVSTLIKTSISTLKIWCNGSDAFSGAPAWRLSIFTCARGFSGVAMVGGDVLSRLGKSNTNDRSHEFMDHNEKKNNDLSSFLATSGGYGSVSLGA